MLIRVRADADLDDCEKVAQAVHSLDGYPAYLRDMRSFLVSADALCAWVIDDDVISGHVALHRRSFEAVMATASTVLGVPREQIGVVARLFVAPEHRGKGFGRALLTTATHRREFVVTRSLMLSHAHCSTTQAGTSMPRPGLL